MEEGVWRTIGGRRIFIKKGKSVEEAVRESRKFKKKNKGLTDEERKKKIKDLEKKIEEKREIH